MIIVIEVEVIASPTPSDVSQGYTHRVRRTYSNGYSCHTNYRSKGAASRAANQSRMMEARFQGDG